MKGLPSTAGIELANGNWKAVRQYVRQRFGPSPCRSSCLNYLHRLEFTFNRPKKRLVKAKDAQREAYVAEHTALREEAEGTGTKSFFVDEAIFRADAELRGKWVPKGEAASVDSNSPRHGEKGSYYLAVFLETGEVEWMEVEGNSNSGASVAFPKHLKGKHLGALRVIWDNAPGRGAERVHQGARSWAAAGKSAGVQSGLLPRRGGLGLARKEATGNLCPGDQLRGAGEGQRLPRRPRRSQGRGETAPPDGATV